MKRLTRRIVGAMLLAVLVYGAIVLWRGVGAVSQSFRQYEWWTFAAACGLASANYLLRFLKWEYYLHLLEIRGIPKGESLLTFLSGFVLTVTPGKVGEVFKSLILSQTRGIPIARSAPIVVAERITDLTGVIFLITVGSAYFPGGALWASAGAVVVGSLFAFVASPALSTRVLGALGRLPGALGRAGERARPRLQEALASLRALTTPTRLIVPTLLSIAAWSLEGIGLWVILDGFGEPPRLPLTAFFYSTATLAGALVPVPGGLGVTEELLEQQLAHLGGVPTAAATAAMLLIRLATLWYAVAVGFAALSLLRIVHPKLRADADGSRAGAAEPCVDPAACPAETLHQKGSHAPHLR